MKFREIGPYRFFFTSNDRDEPPHNHIEREGMVAKFWLEPVRLAKSSRFAAHELRKWSASSRSIILRSWRRGLSSSVVDTAARASHVGVTDDELVVQLVDGRKLSVPLVWFPRLLEALPEQRNSFRLIGDGEYINWPELDEDLSVAGLLRGISAAHKMPARR